MTAAQVLAPGVAPAKCWADSYTPKGQTTGESCGHVVTNCQIGLCEKCAQALCANECRCPKKAVAA